MSDLVERIGTGVVRDGLPARDQSVLIAVSGGLDSMVLLEVLRRLAGGFGWKLTVAHLNHGLRGRSSDADERLVRTAARRFRISCVVDTADVRAFARAGGLSVEMAARRLRHEFLAKVASQRGIPTIALAHHADDQVELFFLRLLRGASPQGLAGMKRISPSPTDRTLTYVRPLLDCLKAELLGFAKAAKVAFREDASNACPEMLRNRIRGELIPLLKRFYQSALSEVVLRDMEILRGEADLVERYVQKWMRTGGQFTPAPVALQRRILQQGLIDLGLAADFRTVEKLRTEPDQNVTLSSGLIVRHDGQGKLCQVEPKPSAFRAGTLELKLATKQGKGTFEDLDWHWEISGSRAGRLPRTGDGCEWFDADRVGSPVLLRYWQPGDRFQPVGLKGSAKVQDLFTNLKVPRADRKSRVVAATAAGDIWWVEGLRIGEKYKLTPETRRRLKWSWHRQLAGGPEANGRALVR